MSDSPMLVCALCTLALLIAVLTIFELPVWFATTLYWFLSAVYWCRKEH